MEVTITASKKFSGEKKAILTEASLFFADQLFEDKTILNDIELDLNISSKCDTLGYCDPLEDEPDPASFEIGLKIASIHKMLSTLAHEMVHLKQYSLGELKDSGSDVVKWRGKKFKLSDQSKGYFFSPWEIEAYGMEYGLMALYNEKFNKKYSANFG